MPNKGTAARFPLRLVAWAAVLTVLAMHCLPSSASASPLLELLGGNFGTGGLNARSTGPSAASAYFNPALLPQAEQGLEVGLLVLNDAINISLDARDPAVDVPIANLGSARMIYPVPTKWLEQGCVRNSGDRCITTLEPQPRQSEGSSGNTRAYQLVGLVNHIVKDRWALALYTAVPFDALLSAHSFLPDEREQYFTNSLHAELYSDRLTPMSFALGTGVKIFDWLSAGVSFTLNLSNTAEGNTFVGQASNLDQTLVLSTKFDAAIGMAPHFSLLIEPIKPLDISLTVHTVQQLEIVADAGTYIGTGEKQVAKRTAVHDWLPLTLALGAAYDVYDSAPHKIAVAATGTFKQWSEYRNRHGESPLPGYEWSDTISGVLGARYAYDDRVATFLDVSYEPTPVPLQTGRTNYVDNDRVGLAAGANYTWPIPDWKVKFRFGAQAELFLLRERHQSKLDPRLTSNNGSLVIDEWADDNAIDPVTQMPFPEALGLQTNNPGWPGFSSSGSLFGGVLSVGLLY